jgi:hypothetical protein
MAEVSKNRLVAPLHVANGHSTLKMSGETVQGPLQDPAPLRIEEEKAEDRTQNRNRQRILGDIGEFGAVFKGLEDPRCLVRNSLYSYARPSLVFHEIMNFCLKPEREPKNLHLILIDGTVTSFDFCQ